MLLVAVDNPIQYGAPEEHYTNHDEEVDGQEHEVVGDQLIAFSVVVYDQSYVNGDQGSAWENDFGLWWCN